MSGDGEYEINDGNITKITNRVMKWNGVIIEMEIRATNANNISDDELRSYEETGKKLGI